MTNKKQKTKSKSESKHIANVQTSAQAYDAIMENKEKLLAAWIAATGIRPEETMLVIHNYADGTVGIFCRKIEEEDKQRMCPQCGCSLTKS